MGAIGTKSGTDREIIPQNPNGGPGQHRPGRAPPQFQIIIGNLPSCRRQSRQRHQQQVPQPQLSLSIQQEKRKDPVNHSACDCLPPEGKQQYRKTHGYVNFVFPFKSGSQDCQQEHHSAGKIGRMGVDQPAGSQPIAHLPTGEEVKQLVGKQQEEKEHRSKPGVGHQTSPLPAEQLGPGDQRQEKFHIGVQVCNNCLPWLILPQQISQKPRQQKSQKGTNHGDGAPPQPQAPGFQHLVQHQRSANQSKGFICQLHGRDHPFQGVLKQEQVK